ncbi:MAG: aminoacyl-tRNA hydrolase [Deltaproteobacteria bacterium]|jgi:PTH1 family peptidyl-tRNA hydrolase|nr:aminoacyl-tRNA hydrolase [Deltaproteobacteria bacterium]
METGGMLIGLGNPGKEYENTRHNFGFMLIDELIRLQPGGRAAEKLSTGKKQYELWKLYLPPVHSAPWLLLKPLTYMNNSGLPATAAMSYYGISPDQVLAVHDELDIPLGEMRFKFGGGSAGHKGINSLAQQFGSRDFYRLRLGIGKQPGEETIAHVLGRFNAADSRVVDQVLEAACRGLVMFNERRSMPSEAGPKALAAAQEYFNGFRLPN